MKLLVGYEINNVRWFVCF